MTQSQIIMAKIEQLIEGGLTDKSEIYARIADEMNVAKPTVRRCAGDLRKILKEKAKILA